MPTVKDLILALEDLPDHTPIIELSAAYSFELECGEWSPFQVWHKDDPSLTTLHIVNHNAHYDDDYYDNWTPLLEEC